MQSNAKYSYTTAFGSRHKMKQCKFNRIRCFPSNNTIKKNINKLKQHQQQEQHGQKIEKSTRKWSVDLGIWLSACRFVFGFGCGYAPRVSNVRAFSVRLFLFVFIFWQTTKIVILINITCRCRTPNIHTIFVCVFTLFAFSKHTNACRHAPLPIYTYHLTDHCIVSLSQKNLLILCCLAFRFSCNYRGAKNKQWQTTCVPQAHSCPMANSIRTITFHTDTHHTIAVMLMIYVSDRVSVCAMCASANGNSVTQFLIGTTIE